MPNLITPSAWTAGGPGTVTVNQSTGQITIAADGTTKTYANAVFPAVVGRRYWLTYHLNGSAQMFRMVGSAQGLQDYVNYNVSTPGAADTKLEFTATSTTIFIEFSRTTAGSPAVSSIILEEAPTPTPPARRLNGRDQRFSLDAFANGLRTANSSWFIGGWIKFSYTPTGAFHILDFGRPDPSGSGAGQGRVRIAYDFTNTLLFASSGSNDDTSYRQNSLVTTLKGDTWYHIGCLLTETSEPQLIFNKIRATTFSGTRPALTSDAVCRVLTLGAKGTATPSSYTPAALSDWVWCSGFLPTAVQIDALADGIRPNALAGFSPTYHWPMVETATTEASITGAATLLAAGSPTPVVGPVFAGTAPVVTSPMDIIII